MAFRSANAEGPLAYVLCVTVLLSGCVSYTVKPAPSAAVEAMPAVHRDGPLLIGIDPYLDVERQRDVFDERLKNKGILAIHVALQNRAGGRLTVRRDDMRLEFPDGHTLVPADGAAVASRFKGGVGDDIGPAFAFGIVGAVAAIHARTEANEARTTDYQAKELGTVTLEHGESKDGFVYFMGTSKKTVFDGATLLLMFQEGSGQSHRVRLPLRGGVQYTETSSQARSAHPDPSLEVQLQHLAALKARGAITDDEYLALRRRVIDTASLMPSPAGARAESLTRPPDPLVGSGQFPYPGVSSLTAPEPADPAPASDDLRWPPAGSSYVMYERKTGSYGRDNRRQTIRYLGEQVWQGRKVLAFSDGSITTYVDTRRRILARVKGGVPIESFEPYLTIADWPLHVGKRWPNRYRYHDHAWRRSFDDVQYDGTVEAQEEVHTPAGTFTTFRIVLRGTTSSTVLWYSSDLGLVVKSRSERSANHHRGRGVHESELVSYDFKP